MDKLIMLMQEWSGVVVVITAIGTLMMYIVRTEVGKVRSEVKDLRNELKGDITSVRSEVKVVRAELKKDIRDIKQNDLAHLYLQIAYIHRILHLMAHEMAKNNPAFGDELHKADAWYTEEDLLLRRKLLMEDTDDAPDAQ